MKPQKCITKEFVHWSPVNSTHKASDAELWCFFFISAWTNGWIKTRDAGYLRLHRTHYDVTVSNLPSCLADLYELIASVSLAIRLSMCLSNFRVIAQFWIQISRLRDFAEYYNKTSHWILKQDPGLSIYRLIASDALQWRHNGRDSVSNNQPHDCLLNRLFRRRSKKTSKFSVTGLCVGNSPGTGEFPAQRASYAENVSIWWRHHVMCLQYFAWHHENPSSIGCRQSPAVYRSDPSPVRGVMKISCQ